LREPEQLRLGGVCTTGASTESSTLAASGLAPELTSIKRETGQAEAALERALERVRSLEEFQ
jgi:hypothetical protein